MKKIKAPDSSTEDFLDHLRENERVVWENCEWLVVVNAEHDDSEHGYPWLTAYLKVDNRYWFDAQRSLHYFQSEYKWDNWEWVKRAECHRNIKRLFWHVFVPRVKVCKIKN